MLRPEPEGRGIMIRTAGWTLALALLAACASGKKAQPGKYDETCTAAVGCQAGLSCIIAAGRTNGLCTKQCTSNMDCAALGSKSICANNIYCYDYCADLGNCPNGLSCVMNTSTQGTCLPPQ